MIRLQPPLTHAHPVLISRPVHFVCGLLHEVVPCRDSIKPLSWWSAMSCSTVTDVWYLTDFPEAPVPVVKVENIEDRPGGAANVALNIAALGAAARWLA